MLVQTVSLLISFLRSVFAEKTPKFLLVSHPLLGLEFLFKLSSKAKAPIWVRSCNMQEGGSEFVGSIWKNEEFGFSEISISDRSAYSEKSPEVKLVNWILSLARGEETRGFGPVQLFSFESQDMLVRFLEAREQPEQEQPEMNGNDLEEQLALEQMNREKAAIQKEVDAEWEPEHKDDWQDEEWGGSEEDILNSSW